MIWRLLVGDVRAQLATLADQSVQCVVTSPPYWWLRDYGTAQWEGGDPGCDHRASATGPTQNKGNNRREGSPFISVCGKCGARRIDSQLGLEATPDDYIATMVDVFRDVRRVLRDDGTLWLNMGDSYATGTMADRKATSTTGPEVPASWSGRSQPERCGTPIGLKTKDLVGMPWRLAFALQADGWYLRADIIWAKPNPMPESVTDRPTKSHEYIFLLTKQARYYYDAEAIRAKTNPAKLSRTTTAGSGGTRNARSVWQITTQPYPDAHFATFPEELPRRCILAGTSERGCCPACGALWERVVESSGNPGWTAKYKSENTASNMYPATSVTGQRAGIIRGSRCSGADNPATKRMLGWKPTCACAPADPVPCTVLDPFAGSGTTGYVALKHGRNFVGIELSKEYATLARARISSAAPLFAVEQR